MDNFVSLDYDRVVHQTEKAVLLQFGDRQQWVPLSLIEEEFLPLDTNGGEVSLPMWLVEQEGLENYLS